MTETILVLNAGSSSIKFQLFAVAGNDQLERRIKGQMEGIGGQPRLLATGSDGKPLSKVTWSAAEIASVPAALDKVLAFLRLRLRGLPTAIRHPSLTGSAS